MILLSDMNIASNRLRLYGIRAVARMSSSKVVLRDDLSKTHSEKGLPRSKDRNLRADIIEERICKGVRQAWKVYEL